MMWIKSYSKIFQGIEKEEVWKIWSDINNYTQWHDDLDYCQLTGKFEVGNFFMLKPKGAPAVKIDIIELIENKRFIDCTKFFGAKMYDIHELEETSEGLRITSTLKVTGLMSYFWVLLVAKNVANSAPKEMEALINLVKNQNVSR